MPVWLFGLLIWGIPALALVAFFVLAAWFRIELKNGYYRRYPQTAEAAGREQS